MCPVVLQQRPHGLQRRQVVAVAVRAAGLALPQGVEEGVVEWGSAEDHLGEGEAQGEGWVSG